MIIRRYLFIVECDICKATLEDYTKYPYHEDFKEARQQAIDLGWEFESVKAICPNCQL